MDANNLRPEDELNRLERRLASWRPADAGPNADAVLFAAGRASARTGVVAWTVAVGVLVVVAVALGAWAGVERSGRLELARQLRERPTLPAVVPTPADRPSPEEPPSHEGYLTARRIVLERGVDAWVALARSGDSNSALEQPEPTTFRTGRRDRLLKP